MQKIFRVTIDPNVNPIIAKNLAVGAAFSRDSRLQGAYMDLSRL